MKSEDSILVGLGMYNSGKKDAVKEIIFTIENEINQSYSATYICDDDERTEIGTDVGYVADWFDKYKKVLCKKYGISNKEMNY